MKNKPNDFFKYLSQYGIPVVIILTQITVRSHATGINMDEPTLNDLSKVLVNVVKWLIFLVGIVFVAVVAYGAWKGSTALGDPRGLDSAKGTWTYAIYGALIVLLFFSIFTIVGRQFGFSIKFEDIFSGLIDAINDLTKLAIPES